MVSLPPPLPRPRRRHYGLSCRKPLRSASGVLDFGGISCVLNVETEYDWVGVVMAEDFDHKEDFDNKNVAMVAGVIGGVVLLLGLGGILVILL